MCPCRRPAGCDTLRISKLTVIAPGEGEVIGDAPDRRVDVISDHTALHATWSRFGPRRHGADLHVHRGHLDVFYVLAGELTVSLGPQGRDLVAPAGNLVRIPPLVVHGFRNGGDAELRYLNFHAPGSGFAEYLRAMRDGRPAAFDQEPPPPDGGRPPAEATVSASRPAAGGVTLLADDEAIGIAEAGSDPCDPSPSPHVHRRHVESLYVLEGELRLTSGNRDVRVGAGCWVQVPPGVVHAVRPGPAPLRLLAAHTPNCGFGALVRALQEPDAQQAATARAAFDCRPAP